MPKYNVYVRKEDDAKWQAIVDKPGWLHIALNTSLVEMAINRTDKPLLSNVMYGEPGPVSTVKIDFDKLKSDSSAYPLCKHGAAIGLCKFGCKK